MKRTFALFLLLLLTLTPGFGQSKKQKELEARRQELLGEISAINKMLSETKGEKRSVLAEVEDIDMRIAARENLIRITNQQANLLTREINANMTSIEQLREELATLKEDYAKMIVRSYKSKSQQSRLMFLLSSQNFLQAYKRVQYMKQYTNHRKRQGERIKSKTEQLQELNAALLQQRKDKEVLVVENRRAKDQLAEEKKVQEALVASLLQDESKYVKQIRAKQREADQLDREIDRLIKEAIAAANKEAGKKAGTRKAATLSSFDLTPEAAALATSFKNNKGKLSWPVEKGRVLNAFGKRRHPQFPNVTQNFSGVEIITENNARARAVFRGEVMQVQQLKGANKAVYVRHGNYITIYSNLATVSVKKGDEVNTKQQIGTVFTHPTTGRTVLKFFIYQNTKKMNPADWIYRM